ncbi:hypothetical protein RHMOL_Rhmol01G0111100 [Rhododendron molle]|uniref:Uncharacterized protein n=1 Tax=Rhododendron molle TaxID=49168 RepID=A0ACC0Q1L4_RHOML|nr:hypothetical protein RHMOL_Rhmol01G0111100 [Rhododendron molle]
MAADMEAEEREAEEAQGPRVRAEDEAGAVARPEFSTEAYMPPVPHLFVPSGFQAYKPQQTDYDVELVGRDPRVHIANTWAEMYPPECKHPDLSTLPRTLIWSKENMGTKEGRGSLNAYRLYLDDLRASQIVWNPWRMNGPKPEYLARSRAVTASRVLLESAFGWQWYLGDRVIHQSLGYLEFQVPGPLPPRASHTGDYTLAELERFTRPDTELTHHLCPEMDYAAYRRDCLARPLGVRARRKVQEQAREAAAQRRTAGEVQRGRESRKKRKVNRPVVGRPPELSWKVPLVDTQGNPTEIHLVPTRAEPPSVTVLVPNDGVNEAIRRMLALENVVRRAASGLPLELRYPALSPPRAQRAAAKRPQVYNDTFLLSILTIHLCF